MALHDDLLEQAHHLALREASEPRQASLRRAVSGAYYAVFHLLIHDAISHWSVVDQRAQLARMFEHAKMNRASLRLLNSKPFSGDDPATAAHLRIIATAFTRLYQHRQTADYDLAAEWSRTQVVALLETATAAFESMEKGPRSTRRCRLSAVAVA